MSLDTYPIGIDQTRLQRVADVMYQFNLLPIDVQREEHDHAVADFNFSPFSAAGT